MKKMIITVLTALTVMAAVWAEQQPPQSYQVGSASTMILAMSGTPRTSIERSNTTTYAAEQYVWVTNSAWLGKLYFFSLTGGVSAASSPTFVTTNDVVDGACTWRAINPKRAAFSIINNGTGTVSIAYGYAAKAGKGITLFPNGGSMLMGYEHPAYQGAIYGISASGVINTVAIHEE